MSKVTVQAVASLDGFVAGPDDVPGPLFDWYGNGDVPLQGGDGSHPPLRVSRMSHDFVAPIWAAAGAMVIGRRLFDITNGWNGVPVVGDHVFVVTHAAPTDWDPGNGLAAESAPFTFVTTGVADAIEQAKVVAGERNVVVSAGDVGGQALLTGLVDEVAIDLVPVFLGSGKPFLGTAAHPDAPFLLEDPYEIVRGDRVLHLLHRVRTSHMVVT